MAKDDHQQQHQQRVEDERELDKHEQGPATTCTTATAPAALKMRTMGGSADCSHAVLLKRNTRGYHRRSQTIVAAGNLELQQLQRLMQVEVLKHDLESKSKELEESQEEAHLAALIGQSLLQRTEEMGAEIESTAIELLNRAENAEHEVKVLEAKLSKAYNHIRSMEVAKARTVDESDEISQELETLRIRMQVLKTEVMKAHDETQQIRTAKGDMDEELEVTRGALANLKTAHTRLLSEWHVQGKRVQELEAAERYNLEHISRLEIENQSICLQHRLQERKEKKLVSENESMATKMVSQRHFAREFDATKRQLENTIEALNAELDDQKDAFVAEQLRVSHLTKLNKELQDCLDEDGKPEEARSAMMTTMGSPNSSAMLRRGSLFYELSMQLKEEMRQSGTTQPSPLTTQQQQKASDQQQEANQSFSQKNSPEASASKAPAGHQNNPSSLSLALDLDDNNTTDSSDTHRNGDDDDEIKQYFATGSSNGNHRRGSHDEQDILKEFFMLTAAAVKIAGGGLGNDTCNILNEDLYEEAMDEGITFDQFHKWLERRLEGTPELSFVEEDRKAMAAQPQRRSSLPMRAF